MFHFWPNTWIRKSVGFSTILILFSIRYGHFARTAMIVPSIQLSFILTLTNIQRDKLSIEMKYCTDKQVHFEIARTKCLIMFDIPSSLATIFILFSMYIFQIISGIPFFIILNDFTKQRSEIWKKPACEKFDKTS